MDTVEHVQSAGRHTTTISLQSDLRYCITTSLCSWLGSSRSTLPKGLTLKTILRLNEPESKLRSHQYSWSVTVHASDICAILDLRTNCWPLFNSSAWLCISWFGKFLLLVQHLLRRSNLLKKNIVHNTKHRHNITKVHTSVNVGLAFYSARYSHAVSTVLHENNPEETEWDL